MWNFFRKILGYKYLINIATGEAHKISEINDACGVKYMSQKNKLYATEKKYKNMLASGTINGCIHCNKQDNTD